jgi:hypothetical protein
VAVITAAAVFKNNENGRNESVSGVVKFDSRFGFKPTLSLLPLFAKFVNRFTF